MDQNIYIGEDVQIGENVSIGRNTYIIGNVIIEDNVWIGPNVCIGLPPQHNTIHYETSDYIPTEIFKEETQGTQSSHADRHIRIGKNSRIREFTTIHMPAHTLITHIGKNSYIMSHCQIAHDSWIGDNTVLTSHCSLSGYTRIMNGATVGIGVKTKQFITIGPYTMIGSNMFVDKNVRPLLTVFNHPKEGTIKKFNNYAIGKHKLQMDEIQSEEDYNTNPLIKEMMKTYRRMLVSYSRSPSSMHYPEY